MVSRVVSSIVRFLGVRQMCCTAERQLICTKLLYNIVVPGFHWAISSEMQS